MTLIATRPEYTISSQLAELNIVKQCGFIFTTKVLS